MLCGKEPETACVFVSANPQYRDRKGEEEIKKKAELHAVVNIHYLH